MLFFGWVLLYLLAFFASPVALGHSRNLPSRFSASSCVKVHPSSNEVVFLREEFEKTTIAKKEFCFRRLFYEDYDYSVRYEREYAIPSGGKLWDSFALDINSTSFFYGELCYEDLVQSKFGLISFDKDLNDVSRQVTVAQAGLEIAAAAPNRLKGDSIRDLGKLVEN
ncbi:hypothetical protein JCM11641_007183 [Rhodosporidiobolus odoratus]